MNVADVEPVKGYAVRLGGLSGCYTSLAVLLSFCELYNNGDTEKLLASQAKCLLNRLFFLEFNVANALAAATDAILDNLSFLDRTDLGEEGLELLGVLWRGGDLSRAARPLRYESPRSRRGERRSPRSLSRRRGRSSSLRERSEGRGWLMRVVVKEESKFTVENKGSRGTCLAESFDFACSDVKSARQGSVCFGNNGRKSVDMLADAFGAARLSGMLRPAQMSVFAPPLCANMPGRTLPTIPQADVASHNTAKSCYVTVGTKVYDITPFLEDHPGGGDLIVEYGGKDVKDIMDDTASHFHSESAWEILDDYLVGFVATEAVMKSVTNSTHPVDIVPLPPSESGAEQLRKDGVNQPLYETTGMSCEEDLSKETDATSDYRTHKFLDLNKPLLMQVWRGGFTKEFYLEQVHRPRHYKGGESAPLFGNFLEPLSKTPWWVVPTAWVPPVAYGTYLSSQGLSTVGLASYWITGLCIWTLVEYVLHRFLFHLDQYLPDNRVGITLHFLLHGIHHYLPMDRLRLVMPPTLFLVLATPFWYLAHTVFFYDWNAATAVFCGGIFGYICYDLTHYFLHHKTLPAYWRELKKYHLAHHFADYENGFGVTSRFWDWVFKTELPMTPPKVIKTSQCGHTRLTLHTLHLLHHILKVVLVDAAAAQSGRVQLATPQWWGGLVGIRQPICTAGALRNVRNEHINEEQSSAYYTHAAGVGPIFGVCLCRLEYNLADTGNAWCARVQHSGLAVGGPGNGAGGQAVAVASIEGRSEQQRV
ncbi:fatty acid hydroxylase, partial [Aureobasidium melanogenum]